MTEHDDDEKLDWLVKFRKGGRLYPYMNRTVEHMTGVVEDHQARYGVYPYAMWAIVDDEAQKVVFT